MNRPENEKSPLQVAMKKLNNQLDSDVETFNSNLKAKEKFVESLEKNDEDKTIFNPSVNEISQKIRQSGTVINEIAGGLFGSLSGQLKQFRDQMKENQKRTEELMQNQSDDSDVVSEKTDIKKPKFIKPKRVDDAKDSIKESKNIKKEPVFPHDIVDEMSFLLSSMSGRLISVPHLEQSWSLMDDFAKSIKKQWVNIISHPQSSPPDVVSSWLDDWKQVTVSIMKQSNEWDDKHSSQWSSWAKETSDEIKSLSIWFSQIKNDEVLKVTKEFSGKGEIPTPPITVPNNFINDLASCADFFESSKATPGFTWSKEAKDSFSNKINALEKWKPRNNTESKWKESALDRYTVLWARMETIPPAPTPSIQSKIKKSKSVAKKSSAVKKATKKVAKKVAKKTATKKPAKKGLAK